MEDYSIFFISHIIEPFLFFCITQNYFITILVPILCECFEYLLYTASGNYTFLYLEEGEGDLESLQDILVYDIGGAILATYYGYTLYRYFKVDPFPVVKLDFYECKVWWFIFLYILRGLILSPVASLGWECSLAIEIVWEIYVRQKGVLTFPGLVVIALVDMVCILHVQWKRQNKRKIYYSVVDNHYHTNGVSESYTRYRIVDVDLGVFVDYSPFTGYSNLYKNVI